MRVDERNSEDILVWGDFWVFNYNQVGDTLKCVSGGSHPGLLHIRQTEKGFEVTAFDQVEDGSRYLPTAKKTMVSTNRLFGDKFDAFKTINSDEKNRERLRAEGLATYAKKNGLAVTLCPSRSTNRGLRIRRLVRPCYQRDGENKNDD